MSALAALFLTSTAPGEDAAPPSPRQAWTPPGIDRYESELGDIVHADRNQIITIDPDKVYDLPELIDLAERSNPRTRTAWERARQAAHAVGLTQSAYFPYLVASAAAGFERAFIPFPSLAAGPAPGQISIVGGSTLTTDAALEKGALDLKWLLFDFGERKATVQAAREKLMMADVGFNAVHQRIVFDVTRHFYELDAARQKVAVAESTLTNAQTVAEAALARFTNGLGTKPENLGAEEQEARAAFELEGARGQLSDARVALVESLGVAPTIKLQVAAAPDKLAPENINESLEAMVDRALSQRPDLVVALAHVRASRAEVRKAKAAYYPKISLGANVGVAELNVSTHDSPYFGGGNYLFGAGLSAEWPIFDGFARRQKMHLAESELQAAESELAESRDVAVREVWQAYTDFKTALRQQAAATKMLEAAQSAFDASLEAYRHGLATYVEVMDAQRNFAFARSIGADTQSAIHTAASALALSVGDLAKPPSQSTSHHR